MNGWVYDVLMKWHELNAGTQVVLMCCGVVLLMIVGAYAWEWVS